MPPSSSSAASVETLGHNLQQSCGSTELWLYQCLYGSEMWALRKAEEHWIDVFDHVICVNCFILSVRARSAMSMFVVKPAKLFHQALVHCQWLSSYRHIIRMEYQ